MRLATQRWLPPLNSEHTGSRVGGFLCVSVGLHQQGLMFAV
jgi:hypothetical protein